jgi:hypothetical protein
VRRLTIVAVALVAALLAPTPAFAIDPIDTTRLRNAVTVSGILAHERIFQRIANQNGGTRASGTPGYDASAAYVERRLEAAGYTVTRQEFKFPFFQELAPAEVEQVSPTPTEYEESTRRTDLVDGTLGREFTIPVVGLSFADGQALYQATQAGEVVVRVFTSTVNESRSTTNVIADSPGGNADRVLVVGAHLDSVAEGPGINDNGSGSATILEIAEEISELGITPRQKLRFAFWGAEESGLLGSERYVENLSDEELQAIWANLNFDMLGSPNYVRFIYDGDGSATDPAGPPGSGQIEQVFLDYFAGQGLATEPTPFSGRSDYGPFIAVGSPPAACSAAPRASRPRSRPPSTAAPPVSPTTPATTSPATTSPTSAPGPCSSSATPPPTRSSPSPEPAPASSRTAAGSPAPEPPSSPPSTAPKQLPSHP